MMGDSVRTYFFDVTAAGVNGVCVYIYIYIFIAAWVMFHRTDKKEGRAMCGHDPVALKK